MWLLNLILNTGCNFDLLQYMTANDDRKNVLILNHKKTWNWKATKRISLLQKLKMTIGFALSSDRLSNIVPAVLTFYLILPFLQQAENVTRYGLTKTY